jgi:5-methylcytosine-specific restriction endonuclease McrA
MTDKPHEIARSPHWSAVRTSYLKTHSTCAACGSREHLEVHHIQPFHLHPELELVESNLLTLCESPSHNCHLIFGHLLAWPSWNANVVADAAVYRHKVESRPNVAA